MNRFIAGIYFIAIVGTFLIVAWLVSIMRSNATPEPLGAQRAAERRKARAELGAATVEGLNGYGWVDQSKGIARMPVSNAMVLTVREWQKPAAARSNMIAVAERAAAAAPAAPPPPNPYE
jgi:LmbE family N-acetylglucosaminyl deacetylase